MNTLDFYKKKKEGEPISMVTCYDHWTARIISETNIDAVLVGDSLAMVVYGFETTLHATTEMMARHSEAVVRGAKNKFVIADMPFMSYRKGICQTLTEVETLMRSGAQAVKLEGVDGHEDTIEHIVGSGVPVMGHIGLTPQSIHQLGGFRVQGKQAQQYEHLKAQARKLQDLGCFSLVLECVPLGLAKEISDELEIACIGIGAGPEVDGQVLVLQDLLGMNPGFRPKFLRTFAPGFETLHQALQDYDEAVKERGFPTNEESYS